MIRARSSDVEKHLVRHRLAHAQDPSNADARFLRVRVRREVLPLLTELSPAIVTHLCSLADEAALPEIPPLFDADGRELRLGRAQRREIRQALRDRSGRARVLLQGARTVRVSPKTGRLEIADDDSRPRRLPKSPQRR
jgi:tRNA(Ile)-lysidine synthase